MIRIMNARAEPIHPSRSLSNPFTGAEIGLAILGLGAVAGLVWWATKSSGAAGGAATGSAGGSTVDFSSVSANMLPNQMSGQVTSCPSPGVAPILQDQAGNEYYATLNGCAAGLASITVTSGGGSVLSVGTTYVNVPLSYLAVYQ